jgi:hypothetical protein
MSGLTLLIREAECVEYEMDFALRLLLAAFALIVLDRRTVSGRG